LKEWVRLIGIIDTFQEQDKDFELATFVAAAVSFYGFDELRTNKPFTSYLSQYEIKVGKIIQEKLKKAALKVAEKIRIVEFDSLKIAVFNDKDHISSFVSKYLRDAGSNADFVLGYTASLEGYLNCSLRAVNSDVIEFAKRFGGGGHAKAAGFQIKNDAHGSLIKLLGE